MGSGCHNDEFFCNDLQDGIEFGTTSTIAMRSCHGISSISNCTTYSGCCTLPGGLCNSPDTQASANELCRALGYIAGSLVTLAGNYCPNTNYVNGIWGSDYVFSDGYGQSYRCGSSPVTVTVTPTSVPTLVPPTVVSTEVPTPVSPVSPTPSPIPHVSRAVCSDIVTTVNMWGKSAKGVALDAYTNNQLHWIGCMGDGCSTSSFFCNDLQDGIEIGATSSVMRSCYGMSSISNCTSYSGCCTSAGGLCNSPDTQASADELCRSLGYSAGSVVAVSSHSCPMTNYANGVWGINYANSSGYGKSYRCGSSPVTVTVTPTSVPTLVPPTVVSTEVPTPVSPVSPTPSPIPHVSRAVCSDIVTTVNMWGVSAKGVALGTYTNNQLHWIGALGNYTGQFYCDDLWNGISFGSTGTSSAAANRACHGVASLAECVPWGCCSEVGGMCNSPDTNTSVNEICRALGYSTGSVDVISANSCPETNFVNGVWASDFISSHGYGRRYSCRTHTMNSSGWPTISPSTIPTPSPTHPPTMLPSVPWAPSDGLVAYFPFNGDANDQSGGGVQGNVYGAKRADDRHGNPDSAYEFDGIDDFIQLPHFAGMDTVENVGEVTVSWWQKILALDSAGRFSVLDTGSHTWNVGVTSQGTEMEIGAGTSIDCPSVQSVVGMWMHAAVSFDDSANIAKVYKDGVLECTLSVSGHMATTTADLYIGMGRSGSNTWATGLIDEVRIYSRMVSDMEVMLLYTDQGVFDGDDVVGDDDGDEFFGLSVSFWSAVLGVLLLMQIMLLIGYCCGCIRCARKRSPDRLSQQLDHMPLPPTVELTREVITNVPSSPFVTDKNSVASAPTAPSQYQSVLTTSVADYNSPLHENSVMLDGEEYGV